MDAELTTGLPARPLPLPLRLLGDERLARLVGSGHEEAFSILYQRHHQALYRYCRSLLGTEADAQDALQSAMTGALVALRVSRRDAPIRPWLFRIAHNESMTQLRRRRPLIELGEELPDLHGSPESMVEQRGRITRLLADLRQLPERQRGALVMRELSGLSHQEVAEALGISVGAAKQTVFEARRSLQEFEDGRSMACEDVRRLISEGDGRSVRGRRVRAHLRDCHGCATFAAAIPQRRADLHAITPALPASAAAGLLWRVTGAGSGQGGSNGAGLISGATSKAVVAGASSKLLATGALIVVTAAVGAGGIIRTIARADTGGNPATAASHGASKAPGAVSASVASARESAKLARLLITGDRPRDARAAGASHTSSTGSSRGRSTGQRQAKAGSGTAGQTHRHHGQGQGASGSAGTRGKPLGAQNGSSHGSAGTASSSHPKPIPATHPPSTAGGARNVNHGPSGSGTNGGGSATGKAGASTNGSAPGVTSTATSTGNSGGGSGRHKASAALGAT